MAGPLTGAKHCQQHLEARGGQDRVRNIGGHEDCLPGPQPRGLPGNVDLRLAVQDLDQRIKGGGVFAELLARIESKQRDVAGFILGDLPAYDRAVLIRHQLEQATAPVNGERCALWMAQPWDLRPR